MAEIESQAKITTMPIAQGQPGQTGQQGQAKQQVLAPAIPAYRLSAREFNAQGEVMEIAAEFPTEIDFEKWSVMQQVVMLKKGTWSKASVAEILFGLAYAKKMGLDVMQGDVYSVGDGRIATSNKAKIKMAFATKRIKGFTTDIKELPDKPINLAGCAQKVDLECTVVLDVEGLNKPITRKARLSAWFNAKNPNWVGRPDHMLELNTMAHACEYVHPTETGVDELPDQEMAQLGAGAAAVAAPSVKELREQADAEKRRALPADVPLAEVVESTTHPQDQVPVQV